MAVGRGHGGRSGGSGVLVLGADGSYMGRSCDNSSNYSVAMCPFLCMYVIQYMHRSTYGVCVCVCGNKIPTGKYSGLTLKNIPAQFWYLPH